MEKVSIILPTYNCAATIETALESIIGQTYKAKELIVCDGSSTDKTRSLLANYQPHIGRLISEPDNGIYDAMNKGAKLATGQWLYFLGADDRLFNQYVLTGIFEQLDTVKFDFIYGNVVWGETSILYDGMFNYRKLLRSNICHQAIFIRKALLAELGGFDLRYPTVADWDVNLKLWYNQKVRKAYVKQVIAYFASNGTSSEVDSTEEARLITQAYKAKTVSYVFRQALARVPRIR